MKEPLQIFHLISAKVRAVMYSAYSGVGFKRVGKNFRLYGRRHMSGEGISVGDNCWFEAVAEYKGKRFSPSLNLGSGVSFSDNVHISLVEKITIGAGSLVGSRVYIGDHSHGSTVDGHFQSELPPALRPLEDAAEIIVGANVWIGDGVAVLAGSQIGDGCVVGANSVVKGIFEPKSVIAGAPAKTIRKIK